MIIRSIQGDDAINELVNTAMSSTVSVMISEGIISSDVGEEWLDSHVAELMTTTRPRWKRLLKWLGVDVKKEADYVVVMKGIKR